MAQESRLTRGWQNILLKESVEKIETGSKAAKESTLPQEGGDIPFILSGDLKNTKNIRIRYYTTKEHIKTNGMDPDEKVLMEERLLLAMARRGTAGRVGIFRAAAIHNDATIAIVPKSSMDLDYLFYYFLYKQRMVAEEVESGSRPRITIEHLERLPIPIPPGEKEEEARIVKQIEARLSEVEQGYKYVTDTQQEIVRTFYGVIQNVFRIERIDRWPRQNLNNLVENVQKEISPQAAEFDYPYIDGSDIEPCRGELKAHHTWRDRQTSVEQAVLLDPAHNIVLYVRASPDKRRAILLKADQALCAPALLPLRVKEHQRDKLLPGFLLWSLLSEPFLTFVSPRHKKAAPVRSSTPSVGKVLSYHLPLPDIDTQKEIITKLNRVQEITHAMHTKADDSRNLFATVERAILQKAFQGEL